MTHEPSQVVFIVKPVGPMRLHLALIFSIKACFLFFRQLLHWALRCIYVKINASCVYIDASEY